MSKFVKGRANHKTYMRGKNWSDAKIRYKRTNRLLLIALKRGYIVVKGDDVYCTRVGSGIRTKPKLCSFEPCKGYMRTTVHVDDEKVSMLKHKIIWLAHNGDYDPAKYCIDHINEDKDDNRLKNLRLLSWRENSRTTSKRNRVPYNKRLTAKKAHLILTAYATGKSKNMIAKQYDASPTAIGYLITCYCLLRDAGYLKNNPYDIR